jgi:aspartyl-tRNA(Asn)/glutamyl-tRNA(Gln) amidotransferase subunit C
MPESTHSSDQPAELSLDEVRHLATLARLGMTDAELEKFRGELAGIIGHCNVLASIDTEGVQPTNNGVDLLNVMAEDKSRPSWPVEKVLENASSRDDTLFRVRAVLE